MVCSFSWMSGEGVGTKKLDGRAKVDKGGQKWEAGRSWFHQIWTKQGRE